MNIELTAKEFRRLLDLVYIGNWVLNSTRGDDRFQDYDDLESKIFALSPALSDGLRTVWVAVVLLVSIAFLVGDSYNPFLYFRF